MFNKLYDFTVNAGNPGYLPRAGLIQASDGNFYGTAWEGGASDLGSIYQVTALGATTVEASFDFDSGYGPVGALVQGTDGKLCATTLSGGGNNPDGVPDQGAIDVLDLGLSAPPPRIVGFVPAKGRVGDKVTIGLGPYLGATSVKFNGTSAKFSVPGSDFITTTVPAGATTGPITITTPGGTVKSKQSFVVTP